VLERAGYEGWYVLEQDAMLGADPPADGGPVGDVRASLGFLRSVLQPAA
jgi:inosose dehydratase